MVKEIIPYRLWQPPQTARRTGLGLILGLVILSRLVAVGFATLGLDVFLVDAQGLIDLRLERTLVVDPGKGLAP